MQANSPPTPAPFPLGAQAVRTRPVKRQRPWRPPARRSAPGAPAHGPRLEHPPEANNLPAIYSYGAACLLRAEGEPAFTAEDARAVAGLAGAVAEGLRGALGRTRVGGDERGSGVLVADDAGGVLSVTGAAAAWIEELGAAPGESLPAVVHAVIACARRSAAGLPAPPARARLAAPSGTWLTVSASALSGDARAWAVVLDPSRPGEVLALAAEANDLTAREREVLGMLVRGAPDKVVAARLAVSPHTAREHTGRILRKFGVRTRGELQAGLFGAHCEPWLAA